MAVGENTSPQVSMRRNATSNQMRKCNADGMGFGAITVAILAQRSERGDAFAQPFFFMACGARTENKTEIEKANSTLRASRAVPHPSTDRAFRRLTSEFGWDRVYSTKYGRWRQPTATQRLKPDAPNECEANTKLKPYGGSLMPRQLNLKTCYLYSTFDGFRFCCIL